MYINKIKKRKIKKNRENRKLLFFNEKHCYFVRKTPSFALQLIIICCEGFLAVGCGGIFVSRALHSIFLILSCHVEHALDQS